MKTVIATCCPACGMQLFTNGGEELARLGLRPTPCPNVRCGEIPEPRAPEPREARIWQAAGKR